MSSSKTADDLDRLVRSTRTAGEMAAHRELLQKFVDKGSRVGSTRIRGATPKRQAQYGLWSDKDFLAREKGEFK